MTDLPNNILNDDLKGVALKGVNLVLQDPDTIRGQAFILVIGLLEDLEKNDYHPPIFMRVADDEQSQGVGRWRPIKRDVLLAQLRMKNPDPGHGFKRWTNPESLFYEWPIFYKRQDKVGYWFEFADPAACVHWLLTVHLRGDCYYAMPGEAARLALIRPDLDLAEEE